MARTIEEIFYSQKGKTSPNGVSAIFAKTTQGDSSVRPLVSKAKETKPKPNLRFLNDINVNPDLPRPKVEPEIPFYDERLSTLAPQRVNLASSSVKGFAKEIPTGAWKRILEINKLMGTPIGNTLRNREYIAKELEKIKEPETKAGEWGRVLGGEIPILPLWVLGQAGIIKAGAKLFPEATTKGLPLAQKALLGGTLDAATYGGVVAPAETLLEGGNLRTLAEKEKAVPLVGTGGFLLRGAGGLIAKGLRKPAQVVTDQPEIIEPMLALPPGKPNALPAGRTPLALPESKVMYGTETGQTLTRPYDFVAYPDGTAARFTDRVIYAKGEQAKKGYRVKGNIPKKQLPEVAPVIQKQTAEVVTQSPIPSSDLSTSELVQRIKSMSNDKQAAYGLFAKERNLKPEIDAKEFNRIWDSVSANPYIKSEAKAFNPTHLDTLTGKRVQIVEDGNINKMLWETGMTGSEPKQFFNSERYKLIGKTPSKQSPNPLKRPKITDPTMKEIVSWPENYTKNLLNTLKEERQGILDEMTYYVRNAGGKGVEPGGIAFDEYGDFVTRWGRISNNEGWYQEFFKKHGRKPKKSEAREIAEDLLNKGFNGEVSHIPPNESFINLTNDIKVLEEGLKLKSAVEKRIPLKKPEFKQPDFSKAVGRIESPKTVFPAEMSQEGLQRLRPGIEPLPKQEPKVLETPFREAAARIDQGARLVNKPEIKGSQARTLSEPIIPKGMKERGVSRNLRQDEARPMEMRESLTERPLTYDPINNPETLARVQKIFDEGLEPAIAKFEKLDKAFSPEAPPLLKMIADELYRTGNTTRADNLIASAAETATQAGQYIQTWKLLRGAKDSTAFRIMVQRQIKKLNEEGTSIYKDKWKGIKLLPEENAAIDKLKPGDDVGYAELLEGIRARIARDKDMPATWIEKSIALRHIAMLCNSLTQVRNVVGNLLMMPMRKTAQRLSGVLQRVKLSPEERTQAIFIKREYKDAAAGFYEDNKRDILKVTNKYLENIKLNMPDKRVFRKSRIAEKLGLEDKLVLEKELTFRGKPYKLKIDFADMPEEMRRFTYWLLDMGDTPFLRNAFIDRLASYGQAKGIKDFSQMPQEGFDIALKEALQATYKDTNKLATFLNSVKNPGAEAGRIRELGAVATDAVLPFTKTPINLIRRGIQYSPVNIVDSLSKQGAQGLDELAKGLTGTGIVSLGFLLAKSGIITGDASEDKDLREYNKATGNAAFSVLGKFTYDWAQPFAIPFVIGVETYNAIKDSMEESAKMEKVLTSDTEGTLDVIKTIGEGLANGFKASGNTILELSLLQGVQNILANPEGVMEGMAQIPANYIQQFIPSASSQIARSIDPIVRRTYVKGDKLGNALRSIQYKIPFASMALEPKLTPFGDEMRRIENPALRGLDIFLNPATTTTTQRIDPVIDKEIRRMADLGYKRHIPTQVPNYIEGTKKYPKLELTPQEVTYYQKRTGELTEDSFRKIINSYKYRNANEEAREKLLADAIAEAKAKAKAEIVKSRGY